MDSIATNNYYRTWVIAAARPKKWRQERKGQQKLEKTWTPPFINFFFPICNFTYINFPTFLSLSVSFALTAAAAAAAAGNDWGKNWSEATDISCFQTKSFKVNRRHVPSFDPADFENNDGRESNPWPFSSSLWLRTTWSVATTSDILNQCFSEITS